MSTKRHIFITPEGDECYYDCSLKNFRDNDFTGNSIVLSLSRSHVDIIQQDSLDIEIEIKPGTRLYELLQRLTE